MTMKIYSRAMCQVNDRERVTFKIPSILHKVTGQFEFVEDHVVGKKWPRILSHHPYDGIKIYFAFVPVWVPGTELQKPLEFPEW